MKIILFLLLGAFTVPTYALDVAKVNQVVAEILSKIEAQDDFVNELSIVLDSKTDLTKPSAAATFRAATNQAAWSADTTALVADVKFHTTPAEAGMVDVNLQVQLDLETNVYSLAQYAAKRDFCDVFAFTLSEESPACLTLKTELISAATFQEQVGAVAKAFAAFKIEIATRIEAIENQKKENQSEDGVIVITESVGDLEEALQILEAVTFSEDESGLLITANYEDIFSFVDLDVKVQVKESVVSVTLGLSTTVDESEVKMAMSTVSEQLLALQNADESTKTFISDIAGGQIQLLKMVVTE